MTVEQPDALDIEAQRALGTELAEIQVDDLPQAVIAASAVCGGMGILGRGLKAITGPGKLSMHEFVYYRLFDPALPKDEIARFMSAKVRAAQTVACNSEDWRAPTYDKVVWDQHLARAGLDRPEIRALYRTAERTEGAVWLDDQSALLAYLSDPAHYPLLAKPNEGGRSLGILRLDGVEDGRVRLHDGSARPVEEVAGFIHGFAKLGYLFQEVLRPHPSVAEVTGGALATVRALVLNGRDKAVLENVTLKLPAAGAVADNYWRTGNMMGAVDVGTGEVTRAIIGSGHELEEVSAHPDTGADPTAMVLPDFEALRSFCENAAPHFSGLGLQGWDIALTDRGPVPVELNFGGDVNLQQLAHGRGAMTPAYCEHMRACGYKGKLPA